MPQKNQFLDPWELVRFRRSLTSAVDPTHPDYDFARQTFNALIDRRPAAILPSDETIS